MAELIFNRTLDHVTRLKLLRSKGYENLTASEKAEYSGYAALGAYNVTDLNRVETEVARLSQMFGLDLTTNTNWTYADQFTESQEERYLGNVFVLRDHALTLDSSLVFPSLPKNMNKLTIDGANAIEETLYIIGERVGGAI